MVVALGRSAIVGTRPAHGPTSPNYAGRRCRRPGYHRRHDCGERLSRSAAKPPASRPVRSPNTCDCRQSTGRRKRTAATFERRPGLGCSRVRQVDVDNPDAPALLQVTTPRDLSPMRDDQFDYVPVVDDHGRLLNDPVLVRLAANRYRVPIADSDRHYDVIELAAGFDPDVGILVPEASPLAAPGFLAGTLIRRIFEEDVVALRRLRLRWVPVRRRDRVIARTGWSPPPPGRRTWRPTSPLPCSPGASMHREHGLSSRHRTGRRPAIVREPCWP